MPEFTQSLSDRYGARGRDIEQQSSSLASPQKLACSWASFSMAVIHSAMVRFLRSATPFCWDVARTVCLCLHVYIPLIPNKLATLVVMQTGELLACLLLHRHLVGLERR
jgi:hypothetical protein